MKTTHPILSKLSVLPLAIGILALVHVAYGQCPKSAMLNPKSEAACSRSMCEGKVCFRQLPCAVQKTIKKHAACGKIVEVEKEDKDGCVVYEVEVKKNGKKTEFCVAEDGKYLGMEKDDNDRCKGCPKKDRNCSKKRDCDREDKGCPKKGDEDKCKEDKD